MNPTRDFQNKNRNDQWRIGVDVGGTFTDFVLTDDKGNMCVEKVPSVPDAPGRGVIDAIELAAKRLNLSVETLLGKCGIFLHGSTVATNTMLEGKGAKTGLITTKGFRDSLEIRRGTRKEKWSHRKPFPEVLIPRYLRVPVGGRINRDGEEVENFVEADIPPIIELFKREGVESIAICFFNSFLNKKHEIACRNSLKKMWGIEWITCSANIAPTIGEYERSSTTAINAYVAIRTVNYLKKLDNELRQRGLKTRLLIIQNNGGAIAVDQVAERPSTLLLSGPAAAVGSLNHYSRVTGINNLISFEMGGTSCDVILMNEGHVNLTDCFDISGYLCALPSVEVHTIGAGGGTIAGVDEGGMLFVGPQGAGAVPGPACYDLGGEHPTVTDAHVILGRLKAGTYARGALNIEARLAYETIDREVANKLNISTEDAATGIIRLLEQKLLHAVQLISIERGYDPREFTLVAAGGAGPLHGAQIGRLLGCRNVYIPRLAGTFCALGMLHLDVRHDFLRVNFCKLEVADKVKIKSIFQEMESQAIKILEAEGFDKASTIFHRFLSLRYVGQQWDLPVELIGDRFDAKKIRMDFEREHKRLFGHIQPEGEIEITKLHNTGVGTVPPVRHAKISGVSAKLKPIESRNVWIDETHGWGKVPVYDGKELYPSSKITGPAIINEDTSTIFIGVDDKLAVDSSNNYMVRLCGSNNDQ